VLVVKVKDWLGFSADPKTISNHTGPAVLPSFLRI
jgi:hypothetical protein